MIRRGDRDRAGAAGAGFDVQIDPGLPLMRADAAQLERALANVLENAARYAGDEPVAIRARVGEPSRCCIRVSDHGPGIAAGGARARLRAVPRSPTGRPGTGLGLAIARGFVEANGGRLRAESLPGQGDDAS